MAKKFDLNWAAIQSANTWRDLDEEFTRKVHNKWPCCAQYYHEASCLTKVQDVKIPTLVLHSRDDPIVPVDCVPIDECVANPNVITAITNRGGHICYFLGNDGKQRWYTYACADFLNSSLKV